MKNLKETLALIFFSLIFLSQSANSGDNIIWSGSFETGDFMQWHMLSGARPNFSGIPHYCRPEGSNYYNGDGSCLSLDQDIVRHGKYSAKFTVKNSANGEEPRDCDPMGDNCSRRRSALQNYAILPDQYHVLPYMSERWISFSVYLPDDWSPANGDWGPSMVGFKPDANTSGVSGVANVEIAGGSWRITHRWSDAENPDSSDVPWQYQMFYDDSYPKLGGSPSWDDGVADFPDPDASRQALGSVNTGGWTDWVLHIKFDARGSKDGGTGFLRYYKREDNGPWTKVLDIEPRVIHRGGKDFDRGIGYNVPDGEYGMGIGLYMGKDVAWNAPSNLTAYFDNIRIGNENASLSDMEPGNVSTRYARPSPPSEMSAR